jgi:hypothetical protein
LATSTWLACGVKSARKWLLLLHHHDAHLLGVHAHHAQQLAVEQLLLAADHGDAHAVDLQAGAGAELDRHAGHHRALQRAAAVGQRQHLEAAAHRRVAGLAGEGGHGGAQRDVDLGADAGLVRGLAAAGSNIRPSATWPG